MDENVGHTTIFISQMKATAAQEHSHMEWDAAGCHTDNGGGQHGLAWSQG